MKRWLLTVAFLLAPNLATAQVVTMSPSTLDAGGVLIGSSGVAYGSFTGYRYFDFQIVSCSGAGGTFALSPNTMVGASVSPITVTMSFTPTGRGATACTVNVVYTGLGVLATQFTIRGTGYVAQTMDASGSGAFGSVRSNNGAPAHTSSQNITVQNNGDLTLTIGSVAVSGTNAADFAITSGPTSTTILPGNAKTWTVTFDPAATGARSATLGFAGDAPGNNTFGMPLSGTGTTSVVAVTDASFGIVNVGSAGLRDITVSNSANAPKGNLGVTTATITGGGGWFSFAGCGGGTTCAFAPALSILTSSVVGVRCSPPTTAAANDMQTAQVTFASDTDGGGDNVATLTCTAGNSTLLANMNTVAFTPQLVGTTSAPVNVTVTNMGNVASTFNVQKSGANQSRFALTSTAGCGLSGTTNQCTLAPAQATSFVATFTPGSEGDISAGLDLVTSGTPSQLVLSGRGIDRHVEVESTFMAPDTYRSSHNSVVVPIKNLGEYPLHVADLLIDGSPVWTIDEPQPPFDVEGLGKRDVIVRFSPETAGKAADGLLAVMSDDRLVPLSRVTLSGNGKDRNVQVSAQAIDFGDRAAGATSRYSEVLDTMVQFTNADESPFMLREVQIEGDDVFRVEHDGHPLRDVPLPIASTAELDVVFTPPRAGPYTALIKFYFDEDTAPQTIIEARGRALTVDFHGGGGCAAAGGTPGILLALLALVFVRRRVAARAGRTDQMKRWLVMAALVLAPQLAEATVAAIPSPIDVGGVLIGNTGTVNATLSGTALFADDVYVQIASCSGADGTFTVNPTSLNLRMAKPITVTYTPTTRGTRTCTVNVFYTSFNTLADTFTVRGTGQIAQTMDSSGSTGFGSVRSNNAAPNHTTTQNFTVQNNGDVTLSISSVALGGTNPGDFAITSGGTTTTILPGNAKTWTITFDPTAGGARSATLTFTGDAPGNPTDTFTLTGTGTNGVITVTDAGFGTVNVGSAALLDITVSNTAATPKGNLGVTSAVITGGNSWFSFAGCGGGTSCTFAPALSIVNSSVVGVRCSPPTTATANAMQSAQVTFTSDTDAGGDTIATLTCTAGNSTLLTNMTTATFGPQLVDSTSPPVTVTVTNMGNVAASFQFQKTGANQSQFSLSTAAGCGLSGATNQCMLAPTQMTTFTATFSPSSEGDISAGVSLVTGSTPTQVVLSGRGIDRHIDVGSVVTAPDTYRSSHNLVAVPIKNLGEYPLHVEELVIDGAPVWTIDEPQPPFDVEGLMQRDVVVRFSPQAAGKAADGALAVMSDDRLVPMALVTLTGNGKDRNVQVSAQAIDFGDRAVGATSRYSAVRGEMVAFTNADESGFTLREVQIEGDDGFRVEHDGDALRDVALPIASTAELDIVFAPTHAGQHTALIKFYFDDDTAPQTVIEVRGRALTVDFHGGGGCAASGGTPGVLLALLLVRRRRRRR